MSSSSNSLPLRNPETDRLIKIGGPAFKSLLKTGNYRYDEKENRLIKMSSRVDVDNVVDVVDQHHQQQMSKSKQNHRSTSSFVVDDVNVDIKHLTSPSVSCSIVVDAVVEEFTLPPREIEFLVHLSDVHIPLQIGTNGRMDEFLKVFERLYLTIRQLKKTHPKLGIVMVGDLLQAKVNLKPDTIMVAREFLYQLAQIAPVYIIPGNHDMSEANLEETCTISSIVQYIGENIFYLDKSGLYRVANSDDGGGIVFAVSSLKDARFIRRNEFEIRNGDHLICLYHGLLIGSKSPNGMEFKDHHGGDGNNGTVTSSRYRRISDFEGYPIVLLGDVHLRQSFRSDASMAYCGSLLQLDRGETLDDHGFLFWNIKTKKAIAYDIENDYGYVKVEIVEGEINEKMLLTTKMPKKPRFTCQLIETTPFQMRKVEEVLKDKYGAIEVRVSSKRRRREKRTETGSLKLAPLLDQKGPDLMMEEEERAAIREMASSPKEEANLLTLHREVKLTKEKLETTMMGSYSKGWDLVSISFRNIFSYGTDVTNVINFESGVSNISAPNRHGKTSIGNIIMFALYHRISHDGGSQRTDIISKGRREGSIQLHFRSNGIIYEIQKTIKKKKSSSLSLSSSTDAFIVRLLQLETTEEEEDDGRMIVLKKIDLTAASLTATLALIGQYVGGFDEFICNNTIMTKMLGSSSILYQKPTERLNSFLKLFQLDHYQDHYVAWSKQEGKQKGAKLLQVQTLLNQLIVEGKCQLITTRTEFEKRRADQVTMEDELGLIRLELEEATRQTEEGKKEQDRIESKLEELRKKAMALMVRMTKKKLEEDIDNDESIEFLIEKEKKLIDQWKKKNDDLLLPVDSLEVLKFKISTWENEMKKIDDVTIDDGDKDNKDDGDDGDEVELEDRMKEEEKIVNREYDLTLRDYEKVKEDLKDDGSDDEEEEDMVSMKNRLDELKRQVVTLEQQEELEKKWIETIETNNNDDDTIAIINAERIAIGQLLAEVTMIESKVSSLLHLRSYDNNNDDEEKQDEEEDDVVDDEMLSSLSIDELKSRLLVNLDDDVVNVNVGVKGTTTNEDMRVRHIQQLSKRQEELASSFEQGGLLLMINKLRTLSELEEVSDLVASCRNYLEDDEKEENNVILNDDDGVMVRIPKKILTKLLKGVTSLLEEVTSFSSLVRLQSIIEEGRLKRKRDSLTSSLVNDEGDQITMTATTTVRMRNNSNRRRIERFIHLLETKRWKEEMEEKRRMIEEKKKMIEEKEKMMKEKRRLIEMRAKWDQLERRRIERRGLKKREEELKKTLMDLSRRKLTGASLKRKILLKKLLVAKEEVKSWDQFNQLEDCRAKIEQYRLHQEHRVIQMEMEGWMNEKRRMEETIVIDGWKRVCQSRERLMRGEVELAGLRQSLVNWETNEKRKKELETEAIQLSEEVETHKAYQKIFEPKAFPLKMLSRRLEELEGGVNELFAKCTPGYRVRFEMVDGNKIHLGVMTGSGSDGAVDCASVGSGGDSELILDRLSGAESIFLNVAFKAVCNKMGMLVGGRSSLFIVDEAFDCLDEANWTTTLPSIFQLMREEYLTILFISHRVIDDEEIVDHTIRIGKRKDRRGVVDDRIGISNSYIMMGGGSDNINDMNDRWHHD